MWCCQAWHQPNETQERPNFFVLHVTTYQKTYSSAKWESSSPKFRGEPSINMLQTKLPRFVFKKLVDSCGFLGLPCDHGEIQRSWVWSDSTPYSPGGMHTDGWKRKRMEPFLRFLTPKWIFSGLITKNAGSARNCPFKLWRFAKRERLLPGFEWVLPKHCWRMKVDKDPLVKWWWLFSYCEPGFTQAQTHWCKLACHSCV